METCQDCATGPAGILGHERLFSETMGFTRMHFRCRACNAVWVRHYREHGQYGWERSSGGLQDADTPGRVGSAPP